jgi:hypothetical protein
MKTQKPAVLTIAAASLLAAFSLYGQKADNVVNATVQTQKVIGTASPYTINGVNFNNAMQVITIKDKVARLGIKSITFPAGNIGDRDPITDDEMKFFKMQQGFLGNPITFMQVKLFNGTKEAALAQMASAKKYEARVDFWTIGNEPDLYADHLSDPSWTKDKYDKVFREWAVAMKAADPNIKIAGPVVSQPKDDWVKQFIFDCGDIVDVLSWHWYPEDGKWNDDMAIKTAKDCLPMIERYRKYLKDPETNPKGYKRDIKMALSEWAISWDSERSRHLTDMVGVLWGAEVEAEIARSEIDYSHYFCFNNFPGQNQALFNRLNKPRLFYYLLVMMNEHLGKLALESTSSDEEVWVNASKTDNNDVTVFLINRSPDKKKNIAIAYSDIKGISAPSAIELNENVKYEPVDPALIKVKGKSLSITVSPFSVTVVRITPVK